MSNWPGFKKKSLVLMIGVVSGATCLPVMAQSQNSQNSEVEVEEVIVTGSYLRGSPLDAPSPL